MFPNVPVKKTLEVVREELQKDETLKSRTDWEIDDIMKLLEIWMVYQLVNRFQSLWPGFICIGLKEHMYLMRLENSVTTLYFGRDRWMCMERQQGRIGAVCVEVKRNRDHNSIYLGS